MYFWRCGHENKLSSPGNGTWQSSRKMNLCDLNMKRKYRQKGKSIFYQLIQLWWWIQVYSSFAVVLNISNLYIFRINPVTKKAEPYLPPHQKAIKIVWAYSFVLFMVRCVEINQRIYYFIKLFKIIKFAHPYLCIS